MDRKILLLLIACAMGTATLSAEELANTTAANPDGSTVAATTSTGDAPATTETTTTTDAASTSDSSTTTTDASTSTTPTEATTTSAPVDSISITTVATTGSETTTPAPTDTTTTSTSTTPATTTTSETTATEVVTTEVVDPVPEVMPIAVGEPVPALIKVPHIVVAGDKGVSVRGAKGELLNTIDATGKIAVADFDGNGEDDVVINTAGQVSLVKMDGSAMFAFTVDQPGIAAGDFDGNGTPEFFTVASRTVTVYDYAGKLLKTVEMTSLGESADVSLAVADVNGDGVAEVIAGNLKDNKVAIYGVDGTEITAFSVFQTATTTDATVTTTDVTAPTTDATATTTDATAPTTDATVTTTDATVTTTDATAPTTDATATTTDATVTTTDATAPTTDATATTTDATTSKKVSVCHDGKTLSIANSALKAHLAHGDKEGACAKPSSGTGTDTETTEPTTDTTAPTETTTTPAPTDTTTVETTTPVTETAVKAVNVAAGDVDGDGKVEIIAAMASGGSTVEVYRPDGTLVTQFKAFDTNNGVVVATGDADNNSTTDIIVGDVGGVEVRVFSLSNGEATQIMAFEAAEQGAINGIAVGSASGSPSVPPLLASDVVVTAAPVETATIDKTTTSDSSEPSLGVAAPTCQVTTDGLNTSCNGNGVVLTEDTTVTEDLSVANVSVNSDVVNEGLISNSTVQEEATITGGTLSGDIVNSGTLKDITFAGRMLSGGILAGTITITADISLRLGIVEDVKLAAGAHLIGGKLQGTIEGTAEQPALLENTEITSGTTVSNVVLGSGVTVEPDVSLENVTTQQ